MTREVQERIFDYTSRAEYRAAHPAIGDAYKAVADEAADRLQRRILDGRVAPKKLQSELDRIAMEDIY